MSDKLPTEEQLTAFVLGELDQDTHQKVEQAIRTNPLLAKEVAEIRSLCAGLTDELQGEDSFHLTDLQSQKLKNQFQSQPVKRQNWRIYMPIAFAAAAAMALFVYDKGTMDLVDKAQEAPMLDEEESDAALVRSVPAPREKKEAIKADAKKKRVAKTAPARTEGRRRQIVKESSKDYDGRANKAALVGKAVEGRGAEMADSYASQPAQINLAMPLAKPASPPSGGVAGIARDVPKNTEDYSYLKENDFQSPLMDPLSTFAIDVDTASYANVRRFLDQGKMPPKDAVRIEELINYFDYDYKAPKGDKPFAVHVETAQAPWKKQHRLVRVALQGKKIAWDQRPNANLVFLLDVSGSMDQPNKLPLLRKSMKLVVENLDGDDTIGIVVYAGSAGVVLPPTPASQKEEIMDALDNLRAGGSTNGGAGIKGAYKLAKEHFIKGGINRVILATDGDFNVGTSSRGDLVRLIQEKAKTGVFLSVLGFGMGNYKDGTMEELSNKGNGNYAYIDGIDEAKKVLVNEIGGSLYAIAKDVKIQVEWNPAEVQAYRLVGYENRIMPNQDFHDDKKDGGEIGAGHNVTAFYEVVPHGVKIGLAANEKLKYQKPQGGGNKGELMTLKVRYKKPEASRSALDEYVIKDKKRSFNEASEDFRFAASVAEFGMLLRGSEYKAASSYKHVLGTARGSLGKDAHGYRQGFIEMVEKARKLDSRR